MATIISNQASLSYSYGALSGVATSNIATAVLEDALSIQKTAVNGTYRLNSENSYAVSVTNNSGAPLTNVTVSDNLGSYTPAGATAAVQPLTYTDSARLFINGVYSSAITGTQTADGVSFTVPSLGAGDTATIVYSARINNSAPLEAGSQITNTASASAAGIPAVTDSETVTADSYADISILKSMSPATLTDGDTITYTFTVYNNGNTEAVNTVLTDTFNPLPTITSVAVNGVAVQPAEYNQANGTLTLPAPGSALTINVPPATYTQNSATGTVSVTPGVTTVTVTGTV